MHSKPPEILILQPTRVFLSFLASQLSERDVPNLRQLQTNTTAYVIEKHSSDEETLEEIKQYFPNMFRHEISRWLGKDARNPMETNFFDFLCCFKLQLHSHLVLMESSIQDHAHVLAIKPRNLLLEWIHSSVAQEEELATIMKQVHLTHLAENATLIVKHFPALQDIKAFMRQYYQPVFETAMSRMSNKPREWPVMNSFHAFCQYFSVEIHTQLIYLPN